MSEEETEKEEEESILSKQDAKVLKDLKLQTQPYAQIAEQNLELLALLAESEVNKETVEDASKQLLEIITEKDREIVNRCKQLEEKQKTLDEVSRQLLLEKGRSEAVKKLLKKEIQRRKDLITSTIPSEKSIDEELEQ